MNELQVINEQEVLGKEFRVYGTIDEPLFLAKDVATWIEHSNPRMMLKKIDEDEKVVNNIYTLGGIQETWFLTENGLYEVLMQSRKPIAKAFKKEVKKILKQIRLTGEYTTPQLTRKEELQLAILNGDDLERISALREYETVVVEKATKPLIETIETQKPKVSYHDKVLNGNKLVTTTDIAKDLGMTARQLHNKLHDMKIIFKTGNHWTFYAKYQTRIPLYADYQIGEHGQILKWTEKGRKWIIKLLNEQNEKDKGISKMDTPSGA